MRIVGQIVIVLLTQERDDLFLPCNGLTIVCLLDLPRSVFVRMLCRMHQCFCGNATDIDTCPSVHLFRTLHYGNVQLPFCQLGSQRLSAFAESDDNGIILFDTSISLIGSILFLHCQDRKSTRLNSSHIEESRMPSSA